MGIISLIMFIFKYINEVNNFFPSFGMLYKTFEKSFKDITLLLIVIMILFTGFVFSATILTFGKESQMSSFSEQNQATIEAITLLGTEKAAVFQKKILNLITFTEPHQDKSEEIVNKDIENQQIVKQENDQTKATLSLNKKKSQIDKNQGTYNGRMTFRIFETEQKKTIINQEFENIKIFYRNPTDIQENEFSDHEYKKYIYSQEIESYYKYYPQNSKNSPYKQGGFVQLLTNDESENQQIFQNFYNDNFLSYKKAFRYELGK
ncbi:hypothetical protein PPERSA_06006 [Pseudocohnilembus persalinus]|uniref:Uncharacterized protein n=1 Tax=Pseudocohnilembus persalinus TaxID=266149 RepID=A0A0V0Q7E6_PSEPJ|nr:hypothetical protein PPERSA_06006 [Pseudocohnilembus persalinus]|eukprot:KRW98110.1 hypothetical protein PPERSA_06006 [Pseudocohnilembus persalinus]